MWTTLGDHLRTIVASTLDNPNQGSQASASWAMPPCINSLADIDLIMGQDYQPSLHEAMPAGLTIYLARHEGTHVRACLQQGKSSPPWGPEIYDTAPFHVYSWLISSSSVSTGLWHHSHWLDASCCGRWSCLRPRKTCMDKRPFHTALRLLAALLSVQVAFMALLCWLDKRGVLGEVAEYQMPDGY